MRRVLLVSGDVVGALRLARHAVEAGDAVTLVLVATATAWARASHPQASTLSDALADGVVVLAHDAALLRRGLGAAVVDGVKPVALDEVADLLVDGADRAVWWS